MWKKDNIFANIRNGSLPLHFLYSLGNSIQWLPPKRANIFGSAVTRGLNAKDLDLLIISDYFEKILWQERPRLLVLPFGPTYDLRLFSSTEFETLYPRGNPFRESIEQNNISLRDYYE
jgi:hypothetical protein